MVECKTPFSSKLALFDHQSCSGGGRCHQAGRQAAGLEGRKVGSVALRQWRWPAMLGDKECNEEEAEVEDGEEGREALGRCKGERCWLGLGGLGRRSAIGVSAYPISSSSPPSPLALRSRIDHLLVGSPVWMELSIKHSPRTLFAGHAASSPAFFCS